LIITKCNTFACESPLEANISLPPTLLLLQRTTQERPSIALFLQLGQQQFEALLRRANPRKTEAAVKAGLS
jgi:hypothetical protein